MSPESVAPRGLLVAALVLELPEDVHSSRAAELCAEWAPSAALSVGLVLVPLLITGRPLALPAAAGVWLCQQVSFCVEECVVPFRSGVGRAHLLLGPGHEPLGESHLIVVAAVSEGFSKLSFVVKRLLVSFTLDAGNVGLLNHACHHVWGWSFLWSQCCYIQLLQNFRCVVVGSLYRTFEEESKFPHPPPAHQCPDITLMLTGHKTTKLLITYLSLWFALI